MGGDGLEVQRHVEVLVGEDRRRRATGRPELQRVARVAHAAGHVDELAQRDAERRLVLAGVLHVPGQGEDAEALGLLGPHVGEPLCALAHDERHGGDRLDVVDDRGAGVQAGDGGEGGLEPRLAPSPLEGVQEGGLLAADVGAGTRVHGDVEVEAGAQDVLAEVARRVGLLDRAHEAAVDVHDLAAQVDEGVVAADGEGGDRDALDEEVRGRHEQWDVLAGTRLGLVGVDDEVAGAAVRRGRKPHFMPVGKPAPPRPRRPESFIDWTRSVGSVCSACRRAAYPSLSS